MKKPYFLKQLLSLVTGILFAGMVYGEDTPKLLLDLEEIELKIGETFQLPSSLKYMESEDSDTIEVSVQWTVDPDTLGSIDEFAVLTAEKEGEGYLWASYDAVQASVELEIEMEDEDDDDKDDDRYPKLLLSFKKVKLNTGETYQLPAVLDYLESADADTTEVPVQWTVDPDTLGSIDELAVLIAEKEGEGYLWASYATVKASVELEIEMEDEDDDEKYPKLLLSFKKVKLKTGETYQLPAVLDYLESADADTTEVSVQWTVDPDTLASIDEFAVLTAEKEGEGYLWASYDTIQASVELEIEMEENEKDDDHPKVKIVPGHVKVELGDSLELYAFYIDSLGNKMDTTYIWMVEPAELGSFPNPEIPMFHTTNVGEGKIIATLGELADTIEVKVYEKKWVEKNEEKEKNRKQLTITPGDTIVLADAGMIQYFAHYDQDLGNDEDAELLWSVSDTTIATINAEGLLTLEGSTGLILVTAVYKNFKASAELLVVDPTIDPEVNTITIHRVLPDSTILNPKVFQEGESYIIGGLPYPLNILNSGMLHFPYGCISEDITIFMTIPEEYAILNENEAEVLFDDEVITGVEFNVQPSGSKEIIHPYWFNIPVELRLAFKRGLLESLEVDPQNLDIFFAENAQFVPVEDGVATVDTLENMIYASIEHFSTLVVRKSESLTTEAEPVLSTEDIFKIYPNPVATSATFQFQLTEAGNIKIEIYNLTGQVVKSLADRNYEKGIHRIRWSGDDKNNSSLKSGIYLCNFIKNGKVNRVQKLVINR